MPRTTSDDEQAAHGRRAFLDVVALRALDPDALAEPEHAEQADVRVHEDDDDREREEQALDQLDGHVAGPSSAAQGIDRAGPVRCRATP